MSAFHRPMSLAVAGLLAAGLGACGSGEAQGPAPLAAPADAAAPRPRAVESSGEAQAAARFAALSKEIEKLGKDDAVERAWFEGELKAVLALDPKHAAARYNLAALKERDGDKATARRMYGEILDDHPDFAPAAENLAAFLVAEGQSEKAIGMYRRIIGRDPKNVTSRLALARLLASAKKYEEAIELARGALQHQSGLIEAFRVLAISYEALGNTPMAELIIGRGLKVSKNDTELHYLTAQILFKKKELVAGVNKLKEVVALDPKWLKVRAQLAEIALQHRDFGNAAQQYEVILKEESKMRPAQIGLAVSYKGMGRYEQAEGLYRQMLSENARDPAALWNLAALYHRHLNRYDDAIAFYKRAKEASPGGDEKAAEVDKLIAEIEKLKSDIAAVKAREERERKKLEAIQAACAATKEGKKPDAAAIGNDQERVEVAWQLMGDGQTAIQNGDTPGGEAMVQCAFEIVPETPGAKVEACAPMRVMWTQILYQLGRLDDALANTRQARKCDPNNPDAQLIEQQLVEILAQQKTQGGAEGGTAAPATGQPSRAEPQRPAGGSKRRRGK